MDENQVRALLVEDDSSEAEMVRRMLAEYKCGCDLATSVAEGISMVENGNYNLCIVDVALPSGGSLPDYADGIDIVRIAREKNPEMKIMVLTGYAESTYQAAGGFSKGANDYVRKSECEEEISARIGLLVGSIRDFWTLMHPSWHDIMIDVENMHPYRLSDPTKTRLDLTDCEVRILIIFFRSPGKTIGHDRLAREGLGVKICSENVKTSIRQHISRIRKVTGMDESKEYGITTMRGEGYALLG